MPQQLSVAKERILALLKRHAPLTTEELAGHVGVTPAAIRQHTSELLESGYIEYTERRGAVGRPCRSWTLCDSDVVRQRFPDSHADLAVSLIAAVRDTLGPEAVETMLAHRRSAQAQTYRGQVTEEAPLSEKLQALTEIRSREGYMAEWSNGEEGVYRFVEKNCPVCVAATSCQGICDSEIDVFRDFFGSGVTVERRTHILSGDRSCSYEVRPAD